jgi:pyruvate carboxylase
MTQTMWVRCFGETCMKTRMGARVLNFGRAERLIKPSAGEKKGTRANVPPIGAQQLQKFGRQRNKTVLVSLALHNANHHPLAVDVADTQVHRLADSYARRVDRAEDHASGECWGGIDQPLSLG